MKYKYIWFILFAIIVLIVVYHFLSYSHAENFENDKNIYFITFSGGGQNFYDAGNRLINQAKNLNLFNKTILYTDESLKKDIEFWNQHSTFIENNKRGYGYWLWKSYIIKKTMETMNDGDILLYLDCGCEIDIRKKKEIKKKIELVKSEIIIGTHTPFIEKEWSKMDLIKKMNMLDDAYLNSNQRQAGASLFLICDKTRNIVNQWYELSCDYHNINDAPSTTPNFNEFKEHRHDQSVFSLLTKKNNLYSKYSLYDCIEYSRNISGVSKLNN